MSLTKLIFKKPNDATGTETSWNDHEKFPTIEPDEATVRSDLQLFHDETKAALNNLIDNLEAKTDGASGADQIGATPVKALSSADTVQAVLEECDTRLDVVERLVPIFEDINSVQTAMSATNNSVPTSKAVLDALQDPALGNGDMLAAAYASNGSGTKVDTAVNAEKLGNQLPAYYQPLLTFDNTPTSGSNNPVKSGGIYTFVNDRIKWTGKALVYCSKSAITPSTGNKYHTFSAPTRDDFGLATPDSGSNYTKFFVPIGATKVYFTFWGTIQTPDSHWSEWDHGSTTLYLNGASTGISVGRDDSIFNNTIVKTYSATIEGRTANIQERIVRSEILYNFGSPTTSSKYFQVYGAPGNCSISVLGYARMEVIA